MFLVLVLVGLFLANFDRLKIVEMTICLLGSGASFYRCVLGAILVLVIIVTVVVLVDYGRFWQLELVPVECTWSDHVLGKHVHKWLLVLHLFLHQVRDLVEVCVLRIVIESGKRF